MFDTIRREALAKMLVETPVEYLDEVKAKFEMENIPFVVVEGQIEIDRSNLQKVDKIINEIIIPNLLPAQFYWLLARAGLEPAIQTLLETLKTADPDKYAAYKAFLTGARFYEFKKALNMFSQAAPVLTQAYPDLDLSVPTLKALWLLAVKF